MGRKSAAAAAKQVEQEAFEGMSDSELEIPEIQTAGAALIAANSDLKTAKKVAKDAEDALVQAMNENDRTSYTHRGLECSVANGKVKATAKYVATE